MERNWLEKFYTECGREVSLAYNVLNHTNNWGVMVVMVFLAGIIISTVSFNKDGNIVILYPTYIHWFLVIAAWVVLLRFFARSALALVNMYRWNELIYASSKVLSLSKDKPESAIYERNCARKIDSYYYRFRSPKPKLKVVWHSLKLMYLWFFFTVLILFVWGLISLEKGWLYYAGIVIFVIPTLLEVYWFATWYGLEYERIQLEEEPQILDVWKLKNSKVREESEDIQMNSRSELTHARVDRPNVNRLVAIDIDKRKISIMNLIYRILAFCKSKLSLCPYMKRLFDPNDEKLWVEEVYVIVWGLILLASVSLSPWLCGSWQGAKWIFLILGSYRIFDVVIFHAHVVFLHSERDLSERFDDGKVIMRHPQRWLLFVFFDFVQTLLVFSVFYTVIYFSQETPNNIFNQPFWYGGCPESIWQSMQMGMNVFYFSLVTVVTLGYGDFAPMTPLARSVVVAQILIGLFFLVSVLAIAMTTIRAEADYTTKWKNGAI